MEMVREGNRGDRKEAFLSPDLFLPIVAATLIIFGLHFFLLYCYDVYPFSDRVPSQYDLLAQIVPFAEHFFDVIEGNGSLFYSWRIGGGMDVFGTLVYCAVSPFTFLFWLMGEGNAWYAAAWMLPAKMSCIAASAIVMIRLCFPRMEKSVTLPVALLYAYCGYVFVANTYINWMDFLIWLPLTVPAFRYMLRTGRIVWLSVLIACCIYTCFSIACFSMLISYPICVVYAFLAVDQSKRKEYLVRISLCYFCGVAAALPVLLPALFVYLESGRNTGLFDSLWNELSAQSYYRKLSYVFSDAFFLVLTFYYFCKNRLVTKESRFLLVAGILIMMPVLVDECCILLNMGSYMSYALRFGFLNAVYELYLACLVLQDFRFRGRVIFDGKTKKGYTMSEVKTERVPKENGTGIWKKPLDFLGRHRSGLILGGFLAAAALAVVVVIETFFISQGRDWIDFSLMPPLSALLESAKDASENFASSFAHSTGGLEGILVLFCVVGVLSVLSIVLYERRSVHSLWLYGGMAFVLAAQIFFYGAVLVGGNVFNPVRYRQYDVLYEKAMETEEQPPYEFRVKDYQASLSDNQPLYTDSASYSVFSSMTSEDNFLFNRVFGMGGNGVNTVKSRGGNLLGNCLIGNKYYFYQSEYGLSEEERPTLDHDYLEEVARDEDFILYRNSAVFPSAYTVPSGRLETTGDYDGYFDNMQNIYAFLGGEGDVFTEYTFSPAEVKETEMTDEETGKTVQVIALKLYLKTSGDYTFCPDIDVLSGVKYFTGEYEEGKERDITQVKTFTYQNKKPTSSYSVYLLQDGSLTAEKVRAACSYKVIERETVERLSEKLWERAVHYELKNTLFTTSFSAKVSAREGEQLFLNYVSLPGHKAYVNGKEVAVTENGLNMLTVPLEAGENDVVIEYNSPYLTVLLSAVPCSAILLIGVAFLFCRGKGAERIGVISLPVSWAAVGIAVVVVGFFMASPTGVMIFKLFFH